MMELILWVIFTKIGSQVVIIKMSCDYWKELGLLKKIVIIEKIVLIEKKCDNWKN